MMQKILAELLAKLLTDGESRKKIFIAILSVAAGFLGLIMLPVVVLSGMGQVETPDISVNFDETDFMSGMSLERQEAMNSMTADGQAIADTMYAVGLREQIIKAQLIYFSYFESGQIMDFSGYAEMFRNENNEILISDINGFYGLEIDFDEFMRSYVMVMNTTINEYMFTNSGTKNCADMAAWARNAYVSGWGFQENCFGEMDENLRYRCADNVGLIMGYLRYNPYEKMFSNSVDTLIYNEIGGLDTMPDIAGIGLFDGSQFGVYVGNGEVIFASAMDGCVTKNSLDNWTGWCTFEGVNYPQKWQTEFMKSKILQMKIQKKKLMKRSNF